MKNIKIIYLVMVGLVANIQADVLGQTPDFLNHYLETAAQNNPGVKADFLLYQAALQKVPQTGAWQDPQLDFGFFLQPMEIIDGKQVADIKLMQMFPWFGTKKAARTEMQHMAKMAYEQFRETRDQLCLDVYTQWYILCRLQQQLINHQENGKLLEQLETLALQKFTTGNVSVMPSGNRQKMQNEESTPVGNAMQGMNMGGTTVVSAGQSATSSIASQPTMGNMSGASSGMSDVLRIQLERMELDNTIESLLSEIQAEKVKFNALLNRPAGSEVQLSDSLVQIPFLFEEHSMLSQIKRQNPMLSMITEEEEAYKAKAEMDKKMSYPMFGIGLQYMLINKKPAAVDAHSGMETMNSMNGKNMLMPMLSVSIPVYRGKYKAQQRENAFLQQASKEKWANTQNLLEAEFYRLKNDLDNAVRKIGLYRKQSELAQTTYNLVVNEFVSGKSDLSNVIQVQRQLLDYQLKVSEAIADYNTKVANIQKLISSNEE